MINSDTIGITTEACIGILDDVLFNKNFTAVIIAHDIESVRKIFKKVRIAWEYFPKDLKEHIGFKETTDSTNELSFAHGSSVRVALSSRADTVNRLHISEYGKICAKYPQKAEEIITGAIPSVPESGRIDIESTAEGEFGRFHGMFWDSWQREPEAKKDFKAFFFPWTLDSKYKLKGKFDIPKELKEYQQQHKLSDQRINWYYIEKKTLKDKMKQENPTTPEEAFASSGNKLFEEAGVEYQKQFVITGREWGDWIVYKEPIPNHRYALGADVSHGKGLDSSTCVIWDFYPIQPEVVAEYESNTIAPDVFSHEIKKGAELFNNCLIAPENNDRGFTTIVELKKIYNNIYKKEIEDKQIFKVTQDLGWHTNRATKPKMMFDFKTAVDDKLIKIHSRFILKEIRTYDENNLSQIKFDEEMTNHWDRLVATAIGWQMKDKVKIHHKAPNYAVPKPSYA